MRIYAPLAALYALSLSACAPGSVLRSPSVEGTVTDVHTHRPLSGAFVAVTRGRSSLSGGPLPSGLTDSQGHFYLATQHGLGLLNLGLGYPLPEEIALSISKDGYQPLSMTAPFAHAEAHVTAALVPD